MKNLQIKKIAGKYLQAVVISLILLIVFSGLAIFGYIFYKKPIPEALVLSNSTITTAENKSIVPSTNSKSVCIDPGHGGDDTGAIYGKLIESHVNLTVALNVKALLEAKGYTVYITRTTDVTVAKRARARYCNTMGGDILVSIHHNTYTDHSVNYGTALYYKDSDLALATSILNANSEALGVKDQGVAKFDNSELWIAEMPAVLSEAFFITNTTEYNSLINSNSSRLKNEAASIVTGIENYFANPNQTTTPVSADSLIIDRTDQSD